MSRTFPSTRVVNPENERYNKYMRDRGRKLRSRLQSVKNKPCLDCGRSFPHYVMDFDHVRGEKKYNISHLASSTKSWETIQIEIDKCDLICANCHRIRTWSRGEQTSVPKSTEIFKRTKSVPICHPNRAYRAQGMCNSCYKRWRRGPKFCHICPNPLPTNKAKFCGDVCAHQFKMSEQRLRRQRKKDVI